MGVEVSWLEAVDSEVTVVEGVTVEVDVYPGHTDVLRQR